MHIPDNYPRLATDTVIRLAREEANRRRLNPWMRHDPFQQGMYAGMLNIIFCWMDLNRITAEGVRNELRFLQAEYQGKRDVA